MAAPISLILVALSVDMARAGSNSTSLGFMIEQQNHSRTLLNHTHTKKNDTIIHDTALGRRLDACPVYTYCTCWHVKDYIQCIEDNYRFRDLEGACDSFAHACYNLDINCTGDRGWFSRDVDVQCEPLKGLFCGANMNFFGLFCLNRQVFVFAAIFIFISLPLTILAVSACQGREPVVMCTDRGICGGLIFTWRGSEEYVNEMARRRGGGRTVQVLDYPLQGQRVVVPPDPHGAHCSEMAHRGH